MEKTAPRQMRAQTWCEWCRSALGKCLSAISMCICLCVCVWESHENRLKESHIHTHTPPTHTALPDLRAHSADYLSRGCQPSLLCRREDNMKRNICCKKDSAKDYNKDEKEKVKGCLTSCCMCRWKNKKSRSDTVKDSKGGEETIDSLLFPCFFVDFYVHFSTLHGSPFVLFCCHYIAARTAPSTAKTPETANIKRRLAWWGGREAPWLQT